MICSFETNRRELADHSTIWEESDALIESYLPRNDYTRRRPGKGEGGGGGEEG